MRPGEVEPDSPQHPPLHPPHLRGPIGLVRDAAMFYHRNFIVVKGDLSVYGDSSICVIRFVILDFRYTRLQFRVEQGVKTQIFLALVYYFNFNLLWVLFS